MNEAIIWLVVWIVLAGAGTWLTIALATLGGGLVAGATDLMWVGVVAVVVGWALGIAWFIFAAVQVVLQIFDVIAWATA